MPAVMEQISRMSIEEREKLANWILEGIRNGEVTSASVDSERHKIQFGLMRDEIRLPKSFDAVFDSLDEELSASLRGE